MKTKPCKMKLKPVLTNGVVDLEMVGRRYDCGVKLGDHILGQDSRGRYYVDGILAHVEMRLAYCDTWSNYDFEKG